jgi:alpha-galactosidase
VGRFKDIHNLNEGNFAWSDLPLNAELVFGSDRGRSGWGSPFAVCRNQVTGGYFLVALAWSANWQIRLQSLWSPNNSASSLRCVVGPTGPAPLRMVAAGETVELPEVHFGLGYDDFDALIQAWHTHIRAGVLTQDTFPQPVILNHWGYMEHELEESRLIAEIDIAAEIGAELFMVDAGWFGNKGTGWWDTVGDWKAGDRLPNDLFPIFDHARARGLQVGLWVEIETADSKNSELAKAHPDWFLTRYGKPVDRLLDLSNPEVAAHLEAVCINLVERYRLDMFRLDYNTDAHEGGFNQRDGRLENTTWRHVEVLYGIFERLKKRFPNLQLENCSSGGGRTDIGIASRFTTNWTSDWMKMPRTVRILNGLSMALPPERVNRMFGVVMEGSHTGNLETQLHVIILCHASVSGLTPSLAQANPTLLSKTKKYLEIYKNFIRPFHRQSKVYHHTQEIPGYDGSGWAALELAAPDASKAVAGVFRLANPAADEYLLRPRGLAADRRYRITSLPGDRTWLADGHELLERGITVRLESPLTSRLFLFEATNAIR